MGELRLVRNSELEEWCIRAHRGAAAYIAGLLDFESTASVRAEQTKMTAYDRARNLEQVAGELVDISAVLVQLAEKEEDK